MAKRILRFGGRLDRRELMAGLGAALLAPARPARAAAEGPPVLALQAKSDALDLRPGQPATAIWSLAGGRGNAELRFKRGDTLQIQLGNADHGTNCPELARDRRRPRLRAVFGAATARAPGHG